ncbi:hypothetical protein [Yinghuangia soli]|uniref:SPOR domain-containing protein n=1 Tax=Yinghuangia soli TaxID=2908204 RepID=A0AA41U8P2_9ACTN|nr:hypothetical protein [Yinghuangia soli]MCF2533099.1 hypothetical protein [Yinghuangia soli]
MFRLWRRPKGREGEWFYCVRHNKVEEGPECRALDRLGPYESRTEAEHALEIARERNQTWENDPDWNDRSGGGAGAGGQADPDGGTPPR